MGLSRKMAIRRGEPIEACGLTFYPVLMGQYEVFTACREALMLRLSTLPVRLQRDWFTALYLLSKNPEDPRKDYFDRSLLLLTLALTAPGEAEDSVRILYPQGAEKIEKIVVVRGEKSTVLTAGQVSFEIRPLLCEMNGLKAPDESENTELLEAEEKRDALMKTASLDMNIPDLIASVAYFSGVREKDVNEWTVREFDARVRAISRDRKNALYSLAEISGMVKFEHGNPVPSAFFDAIDESRGTAPLESLTGKLGSAGASQNMKG